MLCVVLMAGIKYLDEHTPENDPLKATHDRLVQTSCCPPSMLLEQGGHAC